LCGGLVVDITGLDRIISIENGTVTTEAGVRVVNLERAVRALGWETKCLPSTWVKSTIGGVRSRVERGDRVDLMGRVARARHAFCA